MLLAYLDESYDKSQYWMAAILCSDDCVISLTEALDAVVAQASANYDTSNRAELHGYALFHAADDWTKLKAMTRARIGIYADALEAISASEVEIHLEGVDIRRLKERYVQPDHPHAVTLRHALERLDERSHRLGRNVLCIADDIASAADHRRSLWHFQRFSTGGYKPRRLERIIDTLHFAPSEASRLVQAVDLVAFLNLRISSGRDDDERAIRTNAALWRSIEPRVHTRRLWRP